MCVTAPSIPVRNIYCPLSNLLTAAITIRHKNPPLTLYINDTACPVNIVASIILIASTIAASLNLYLFNTKSVTILASPNLTPGIGTLLTTIALTIFVVESAIPTLVPIPGVKLGLANIVTLFVLKRYKFSDAAIVLAMRIILATIFTGQAVSFIYSVSGGFLCLIVMAAVNKLLRGQYIFLTGILGAVTHNAGQILAAFFILRLSGIFAYMPFLVISGVITGLFTGLVCFFADRYIPKKYTM